MINWFFDQHKLDFNRMKFHCVLSKIFAALVLPHVILMVSLTPTQWRLPGYSSGLSVVHASFNPVVASA
jgi:hypothetical protein